MPAPFAIEKTDRVWNCTGNRKFRDKYPAVMQWLATQPKVVAEFGLLHVDVSWIDWRYCGHTSIPSAASPVEDGIAWVDVFTDGSTLGQGLSGHAVAAAANVKCEGYKVIAKKAEPLPGSDHSAFRGEI